MLRLGRYQSMATGKAAKAAEGPFRDLARINLEASSGGVLPANFDDAYVTCAADVRNDDNIVLAQVAALFANVHGAIAEQVAGQQPEAVFGYAQVAMQRIYHAIVLQDLLPRILHPQVLATLVGRAADDGHWLWKTDKMPLEFTHGAFRIGHAMVRPNYKLNGLPIDPLTVGQTLRVGGNRAETRFPLNQAWLVQWSHFFEMSPDVCTQSAAGASARPDRRWMRAACSDPPTGAQPETPGAARHDERRPRAHLARR